jgi:hypothetical protein
MPARFGQVNGCYRQTETLPADPEFKRQNAGGGPTVDLCEWACVERGQLCWAQGSAWHRFRCVIDYLLCRTGCTSGPIIV